MTFLRSRIISPRSALVALITLSFLVRFAAAWLKSEPLLFPDEYIYRELSRSLTAGELAIRGAAVPFPAPLVPLLQAPLWALLSLEHAYQAVQAFNALVFSLAALPVFWLGRRLGLGGWPALTAAALTLSLSELSYAGYITTEATTLPLLLAAVAAAALALSTPSWKVQLTFLGLAGLTMGARVQFVVLPLVYLLAVAIYAIAERAPRRVLREQALPLVLLTGVGGAAIALKGAALLGTYQSVLSWRPDLGKLALWLGKDLYALQWSTGLLLLAGALLMLALLLLRPASRVERAFAALCLPLFAFLLLQGMYFAAAGPAFQLEAVHARYFFYLSPLVSLLFLLYAKKGFPARAGFALLSALGVLAAAKLPITQLAQEGSDQAPFLQALVYLDVKVLGGDYMSHAYLLLAGVVLPLALILLTRSPAWATRFALLTAAVLLLAGSLGTTLTLSQLSRQAAKAAFPGSERNWVDGAVGPKTEVVLLVPSAGGHTPATVQQQLFWRPSLRVAALPGVAKVDSFAFERATIGPDGVVSLGTEPLRSPVMIVQSSSRLSLRDARLLGGSETVKLWQPQKQLVQLESLLEGLRADDWLATKGRFVFWPALGERLEGYVRLTLHGRATAIRFTDSTGSRIVQIPAGKDVPLEFPVCSAGKYELHFQGAGAGDFQGALFLGLELVLVKSSMPRFLPDPAACD